MLDADLLNYIAGSNGGIRLTATDEWKAYSGHASDFKPWEYWSLHPATRGVTPAGYCLTPEFFGWIDSQWNPSQTQFVMVYITAYWLTSHSNDLAAYNAYVSASGHTPAGLIISGTLPSASTGTTGTTNTGASTARPPRPRCRALPSRPPHRRR